MATKENVLAEMLASGMPPMPAGHPICDGVERRYGPKRKAWYKLTQRTTQDGRTVVYGSYGLWQGADNGAIGVTLAEDEVSAEDLAEVRRNMEEAARKEEERRSEQAGRAANRAKQQWEKASTDGTSGYFDRKGISAEGVRFDSDGTVLIPLKKYSRQGTRLIGLQKIMADGEKRFNKGMDKVGSACLLGKLNNETPLITIAEGYATVRSIRMALEEAYPAMMAIDAGNLLPVAKQLRADFPDTPFLFAADDDWMLCKRLAKRLMKDFKVAATLVIDGERWPLVESDFVDDKEIDKALLDRIAKAIADEQQLAIDGTEHTLKDELGEPVRVTASWLTDACGVRYIEADIRAGRVIKTLKLENAGIAKAMEAARAVGNAQVVWPVFADRQQRKLTDFNDLHMEESLDVVAGQLRAAIDAFLHAGEDDPADSPAPADDVPMPTADDDDAPVRPAGPPDLKVVGGTDYGQEASAPPASGGGGAKKGGKKKELPPDFFDKVDYLLENFVLIYGTDDAWDEKNRMIIRIPHMRHAFGSDVVKWWLGNAGRRMVSKTNVVFDPTLSCDPDTTVNLYHGFEMQPAPGDCSLILQLITHLCAGEDDLVEWVLKWIAYPLQHKGAKMRTSLIFHGDEGSGKNLFWENVVKRIYGVYGGVIGNAQIESQFNEWASMKLFFVADEVVTRNELRQLKGRIKAMITGDTININPKNMTERVEANHMNFVFLSNELQPLALDKTDRRYLVLWTPPNKPAEFYKAVADQIANGGVEAFYDFLMKLDLGDFSEHEKPPMTRAKADLINLGLSTPERFYREWSQGFLPLPFMCCSAQQLYAGYVRWCTLQGEKFPQTQTFFGRIIDRIGRGEVQRAKVKYDLGNEVKQRTVYKVGEQPAGASLNSWVENASSLFDKALKKYRHQHDVALDLKSDIDEESDGVNG